MKILHALEEITDGEPRVFVLGFFDGCHLCHQAVFKEAAKLAEEKSAGIGVITFYPHPMSVLAPGIRVPLLQSEEEKAESFRKAGMDLAVFIRPTKEFLSETAESFLKSLADIPGIKGIVTGDNFSFGKGASGNVSSMKSYFEGSDVAVVTAPLVSEGGKALSSTTVRTLIEAGKVEEAAKLLGRNYTMSGDVVHGFHRGNDLLAGLSDSEPSHARCTRPSCRRRLCDEDKDRREMLSVRHKHRDESDLWQQRKNNRNLHH